MQVQCLTISVTHHLKAQVPESDMMVKVLLHTRTAHMTCNCMPSYEFHIRFA